MNLRSSQIDRAVRSCVHLEAKRNVRNAYKQLHFLEDILQLNRTTLSLQSRDEIVRASADDLPARIQSEGLVLEGLLNHHRAWISEEITLALECVDKKLGYSAVAVLERDSHMVSEAQKAIIKAAKREAESDAARREKSSNTSSSNRGSRGRGGGRGRGGYNPGTYYSGNSNNNNNFNNNNANYRPMKCVLCGLNGHLANHCRQPPKGGRNDSVRGHSNNPTGIAPN